MIILFSPAMAGYSDGPRLWDATALKKNRNLMRFPAFADMLVDFMSRGKCDNTIGAYQAFKGFSEWEAMLTAKFRAAKILLSCRLAANLTQN